MYILGAEPIQSQGRAKTPPPASSKTDQEAIDATTRQQKPQLDVGQQLTNVFSGLKLPWQGGNGANAKDQQVGPLSLWCPAGCLVFGMAPCESVRKRFTSTWQNNGCNECLGRAMFVRQ